MSHTKKRVSDAELVWGKIKGIRVAMLTTVEESGILHSRPMVALDREFDGEVWFLTMEATPKVDEALHHRQVAVSYVKPNETVFVSLSGIAELVHDQKAVKKLWKSAYQDWLPVGPDDPTMAVLKVHVERAEYWVTPGGKRNVLSFLTKGSEQIGEDVRLDMH